MNEALRLMHERLNRVYMPLEGKIKCDFCGCVYGMGLAGMGICSGGGGWWMHDCPQWESEEEFEKEINRRRTWRDILWIWWLRFKIRRGWI